MLPTQFLEKKYSFLPNDQLDIFMELRNIIATIKPDVTEEPTRNSVTYYDSKKGGHVRLARVRMLQQLGDLERLLVWTAH